jgi:DNA-binding CsgD family transcriptional regulator
VIRSFSSCLRSAHACALSEIDPGGRLRLPLFVIEQARRAIPFENIVVSGLDIDGWRLGTNTILATDVPTAFVEAYVAGDYQQADPVVDAIRGGADLVFEPDIPRAERNDDIIRLFRAYDIKPRVAVPLKRSGQPYGCITVTRSIPFRDTELDYLRFLAEPLHDAISTVFIEIVRPTIRLTVGETRCLENAALGRTSEDIAARTPYTIETVNSYFKSAARKLGAMNRSHAVAEALRRGLIQ